MNPLYLLLGLFGSFGVMHSSKRDATEQQPQNLNVEPAQIPEPTDETDGNDGTAEPEIPVTEVPEPTDETDGNDGTAEPEPIEPSNPNPTAPEQSGSGGNDGGGTTPTIADGSIDVVGGRVTTLAPGAEEAVELRIVSSVEHGTITVNPDNTFALVMTQSDFSGAQSFTYEATSADGTVTLHQVDLNVSPRTTEYGWATGEDHYMLATDAEDNIVVEHGDTHQTVYISGSDSALSLSNIATAEGMDVADLTGEWLANSSYGQTEDTALDLEAGMMAWNTLMPRNGEDSSNWLMFERGYTYDNYGTLLERGLDGEDPFNPIYIGAWGEGERPVMQESLDLFGESNKNVVFQGLEFTDGVLILDAENIILDDLTLTKDGAVIQDGAGITIRNSNFYDIYKTQEEANIVNGNWVPEHNYVQGAYIHGIDGLMIEGNFFDLNGWREDYSEDGSADGGQPPIMFNHNLYVQRDNMDVTFVDNITMRASLNGAQIRPGGFIENNVYIDSNAAGNFGEEYYTLFTDNLVTSGASKFAPDIGLSAGGIDGSPADMASLVDNIITHLADPNSNELDWKNGDYAYQITNPYYDDTIVWNWYSTVENNGQADQNVDGLDTSVLDETTIQNFTAQLLGQETATVADLANYLRAQSDGTFDDIVDSDLIIMFFQEGFGIAPDIRTEASTIRFIPDDLGDGVRWDNRLNWETEDLPGFYADDNVDLGGNDVVFGSTAEIGALDFGADGSLNVYGGKLTLNDGMSAGEGGGHLNIEEVGQLWSEGSDGSDLSVDVSGGRFANTGDMSNTDLTATGGQTILASGGAEYDVSSSKTLAVFEAAAKVGFDGDDGGIAILDMHEGSTVAFAAQDGDLGSIEEFRSGAYGDSPDVQSGIDLGNADLSIDLSGLDAAAGTAFTLMDADEIVGVFDVAGIDVSSLGARDARIIVDYENDSVTLELSSGNGAVTVETIGEQSDVTSGEEALWNALTDGQGVASETAAMLPDEEEDDILDVAA